MAACPKCGQEIEADFGVLNCPSCSAMLSVNFDGSVQLSEDELSDENSNDFAQSESPSNEQDFSKDLNNFDSSSWTEEPSQEAVAEQDSLQANDYAPDFQNDFASQPEPESKEENETMEEDGDNSTSLLKPESEENFFEDKEEEYTRVLETDGFSDVEDFGNSELSSSPHGGILYDLLLDGLDTAAIREELRLELSDKRYRLNVDALLKSVHDGKLIIRKLNAAKTALLVNRLKHLDIEIQWKQNEVIRM